MKEKLTIEALDKMTKEEIEKYLVKFITSVGGSKPWHGSEEKRYIDELELYTNIRFKDEVIARFNRWKVDSEVKHIFKDIPNEVLYKLRFNAFQEEYGPPKYILGLVFPI